MPIYLYLNLFTISVPLLLSFDKRVHFYKKWKFLFPAILLTAALFVVWDVLFTQNGIWGFNEEYLVGIYLLNLPLEEWLFFFTVPYACVFIYETLNTYWPQAKIFKKAAPVATLILLLFLPLIAIFSLDNLYTSITFFLLTAALVGHHLLFKGRFIGHFYRAYLVHLLPFLLVNGVLTYLPVVWYNNEYNLGLRIVSIPVEDTMYSMLLLLLNISIFEGLRQRAKQTAPKPVTVINDVQPARAN